MLMEKLAAANTKIDRLLLSNSAHVCCEYFTNEEKKSPEDDKEIIEELDNLCDSYNHKEYLSLKTEKKEMKKREGEDNSYQECDEKDNDAQEMIFRDLNKMDCYLVIWIKANLEGDNRWNESLLENTRDWIDEYQRCKWSDTEYPEQKK